MVENQIPTPGELGSIPASVNFFIYAFTSSMFREVVKNKYGKCFIIKWAIDIMGHCSCTKADNIENGIDTVNSESKFKKISHIHCRLKAGN